MNFEKVKNILFFQNFKFVYINYKKQPCTILSYDKTKMSNKIAVEIIKELSKIYLHLSPIMYNPFAIPNKQSKSTSQVLNDVLGTIT